jgi:ABC-2 type transport system permease protein
MTVPTTSPENPTRPDRASSGHTAGITIVAKQEFRVRLRTGRWRWLLAAWVAVVAAFTVLLRIGLATSGSSGPNGIPLFGAIMLFVLGLALLVAPALTAQSINGDRERGTLATVQVTRLSAVDIAVGKLLAAWGTALVFLALTLPFVGWAIVEGGVGIGRALVVLAIVGILVGIICAVAQGLSALFARGITSTLMSYLLVFALTVGTLIAFGLALAITTTTEHETLPTDPSSPPGTVTSDPAPQSKTYVTHEAHPEYVWWLMAPNPFVVLADSAPAAPLQRDPETGHLRPTTDLDPLSGIGLTVRQLRMPRNERTDESEMAIDRAPSVWPYGLAFDALLGVGSVWISVRRLRTPVHKLGRGVRIA